MMAAAIPYPVSGYEVILDFSVPPWFLDTVLRIAKMRTVSVDYVVLRPLLEVCKSRAASRSKGIITDYRLYKDLYHDFDEAIKNTISDDTSNASSLAAAIMDGLRKEKFALNDYWCAHVQNNFVSGLLFLKNRHSFSIFL